MRNEISSELVQHVADLARLEITPAERDAYRIKLARILSYVSRLQELSSELDSVELQTYLLSNLEREDVSVSIEFDSNQMISNAPKKVGTAFQVPKIIE